MKTLKTLSVLFMFAIIAYVWYVTNEPQPDTWISEHSEISTAEIYGEMVLEESKIRMERER